MTPKNLDELDRAESGEKDAESSAFTTKLPAAISSVYRKRPDEAYSSHAARLVTYLESLYSEALRCRDSGYPGFELYVIGYLGESDPRPVKTLDRASLSSDSERAKPKD